MFDACICIRKNSIIIVNFILIMVIKKRTSIFFHLLFKFNDIKKYGCL